VFQLTPPSSGTAWTETPLYGFTGGTAGGQSSGSLVLDAGVLFGKAALGGALDCPSGIAPVCGGVVFKISP
jgi:hypothetical protein